MSCTPQARSRDECKASAGQGRRRDKKMSRLIRETLVAIVCVAAATIALPADAQTAPTVASAVSRKVHGAAGTFDLPLSLDPANPSVEPRAGSSLLIVFTFNKPVSAGTASITQGVGQASAPTFSGAEMRVPVTGATNAQYVTVSVSGVVAVDGGTGGSGSVRVGLLLGDVNQNRVVTLADLGLLNAQLTQPVTASNFRLDVNASGTLTLSDKGITNGNLTTQLPPLGNLPPVASAGVPQAVQYGRAGCPQRQRRQQQSQRRCADLQLDVRLDTAGQRRQS